MTLSNAIHRGGFEIASELGGNPEVERNRRPGSGRDRLSFVSIGSIQDMCEEAKPCGRLIGDQKVLVGSNDGSP